MGYETLNFENRENPPHYDFKKEMGHLPKVGQKFIEPFVKGSDDFILVAEEVVDNPYIKKGEKITDARYAQFCLKMTLNHINNQEDQGVLLSKENTEDDFFDVAFKN